MKNRLTGIITLVSNVENQHMNSVFQLLKNYNINDPASTGVVIFNNMEMQSIYYDLIAQSDISLLEDLKVGDKIEDLSLNENRTTKINLFSVYSLLKCGAKNHLESFHNQVLINNGEYSPKFISQEDFDAIVNSFNEKCVSNLKNKY